eukprot:4739223-Prorocentrum_lima.AAC.1
MPQRLQPGEAADGRGLAAGHRQRGRRGGMTGLPLARPLPPRQNAPGAYLFGGYGGGHASS